MVPANKKKYYNALHFLESLKNIPTPDKIKKMGDQAAQRKSHLPRLEFLLDLLGHPEKDLKCIHVTGTSGKGSVTTLIQSILAAAGFRTGGFLSPHITTELERIKFNDEFIAPEDFAGLVEELKPHLTRCAMESPWGIPAFFEVILAMAFLYFKEKRCEYVVLEVGVGGEWDPTNVVRDTAAAVITNVGLDHQHLLGKNKTEIARDKAGIIKKGSRILTTEKSPAILKIFKEYGRKRGAGSFTQIGFDFEVMNNGLTGIKFKYDGHIFRSGLSGEHQARNIILAMEAVRPIVGDDYALMQKGIDKVAMPARLEIVQENPLVVIDGAHNKDKMATTVAFASGLKHKKIILVTALAGNKEAGSIFKQIMPLADRVFITRFLTHKRQSADLKRLLFSAKRFTKKKITVHIDPWQALDAALAEAKKDDLVLVTGSFFLTGELRKRWFPEEYILEKRKMI